MKSLNPIIWRLPSWIHEKFLDMTRWRLVRVTADGQVRGYFWTNTYPPCEDVA